MIRVPLYLSSRCGVWKRSCSPRSHAQLDQSRERGHFVLRALVQADFADAQHVGLVEKLGQQGDHLAGEGDVFGLLGVDADPGVVANAVVGRAFRLPLGELPEVVVEAVRAAAVVAHPEGRLADRHAAHLGHRRQIVGRAGGDMDVRVDKVHDCYLGGTGVAMFSGRRHDGPHAAGRRSGGR